MIKLLRFLKPYRLAAGLVLLLVLGQSLAELYLHTLMAIIVDQGEVTGNTGLILRVGGRMLLAALGGTAVALTAGYLAARVAGGIARDLRREIFNRVVSFPQIARAHG